MKKYFTLLLFIALCYSSYAQITGKLIDVNGNALSGLQLKLIIEPNHVYNSISASDGSFSFNNVSKVNEEKLPTGYSISENFPNPFNPKTRIFITLPNYGRVKVSIYNVLGQKVLEDINRYFNAGTGYIDLELNGLSNGIYFANISLDDKYTVTKKLMLLYGSQHLNPSVIEPNFNYSQKSLDKTSSSVIIDSIVVTGNSLVKNIFTGLPPFTGSSLDLGSLNVNTQITGIPCPGNPTITYAGQIYNTVQIGNQCWLRENLNVGTIIDSTKDQTNNGIIEKYCYHNNPNNCAAYGGLYQWAEAVQYQNGASNTTLASPSLSGAQGICPSGWHLPTLSEFNTLISILNSNGNSLKAVGQGTNQGSIGAGTNTSGFSALLSGDLYNNHSFMDLGANSYFWSSTDNSASEVNEMFLNSFNGTINISTLTKASGFSVRCLKYSAGIGTAPIVPTQSYPTDGAAGCTNFPILEWLTSSGAKSYSLQVSTSGYFNNFVYNQSGITTTAQIITGLVNSTQYYWRVNASNSYGTSAWSAPVNSFTTASAGTASSCAGVPTVIYGDQTYHTVQIGSQCWLKENLNIGTQIVWNDAAKNNGVIEKFCYNDDVNNCNKYGGLYEWNEAMAYSTNPGTQGICPSGWHIPNVTEYQALNTSVGDSSINLKAVGQGTQAGSGKDIYGFSALLAGCHFAQQGSSPGFALLHNYAFFWCSTPYDPYYAYALGLNDTDNSIKFYQGYLFMDSPSNSVTGNSVRCLKD